MTLHIHLADIPSGKYPEVGELVRQDFIDLSSSLEKKAFAYFVDGIHRLRLDSLDEHQKYKRSETERRLGVTSLFKKHQQVQAMRQPNTK